MFYENQLVSQQCKYKDMLLMIGSLSYVFSEGPSTYLPYRAHENIFCKYFEADNLGRYDCSVDAKKNNIGIALKTWMGNDDQKIAEFGRYRSQFQGLSGLELVKVIAQYRNERIRITKNIHGIDSMIYHIVKRVPGSMLILEHSFDYICVDNITIINDRGNYNNTYFTDGKNTYHFSASKNTLYMLFENMVALDNFEVDIIDNPFESLGNLLRVISTNNTAISAEVQHKADSKDQICLRLYSTGSDGIKQVYSKSGLNQWNAAGRPRNPYEVYIPYPSEDRARTSGFFPPRNKVFELVLPDGVIIPAKVCQADGKAIMSNPNRILGEWLLSKVFELSDMTLVTYEMLEKFGIDSVVFTKLSEYCFSIDFASIGTYEEFYNI